MKNPIHKNKVAQLKANSGVERKMALEKGDIWIRPTTYMGLKTYDLHGTENYVQP